MQVPLGVLLKSENNYDDMIDIMDHLHKYVPSFHTTEDVTFQSTGENAVAHRVHFHPLIFGGDQLTVKRARGGQKIRSNSKTEDHKLGGLVPVAEDWHAKVVLLEVRHPYHLSVINLTSVFIFL